jgi:hypothetical protein
MLGVETSQDQHVEAEERTSITQLSMMDTRKALIQRIAQDQSLDQWCAVIGGTRTDSCWSRVIRCRSHRSGVVAVVPR